MNTKEKSNKKQVVCFGIKVENIDSDIAVKLNMPGIKGVIVVDLEVGEDCYDIGLQLGDVIVEVNREKVADVNQFDSVMSRVDFNEGVIFDIIRNGKPQYISFQKNK